MEQCPRTAERRDVILTVVAAGIAVLSGNGRYVAFEFITKLFVGCKFLHVVAFAHIQFHQAGIGTRRNDRIDVVVSHSDDGGLLVVHRHPQITRIRTEIFAFDYQLCAYSSTVRRKRHKL